MRGAAGSSRIGRMTSDARRRLELHRQLERGAEHPDDGAGDAVHVDDASDDRRIGGEAAAPQRVREQDEVRAALAVLAVRERAAEHRLRAEHVERVRRDERAGDALGIAGASDEVHRHARHRRDAEAAAALGVIEVFGIRHAAARAAGPVVHDRRQRLRLPVGQRREHHRDG
jgi:hypothetical protein